MRKTLKKIMSMLLVLTLILGSGYGSYAQNTSIHLKTGNYDALKEMSISVYISGHYGTPQVGIVEHVTLDSGAATKLFMTTTGNSGQFTTTDLELEAEPIILYFQIGDYKYYVGTHISRIGNEGGGTMNYEVTSMPSYTVSYDANTGTGSLPAPTKTYVVGTTVNVLGNINNLTKIHNSFTGWNTEANGSGTPYVGGNIFTMGNANVVLYAQWTPNPTYNVTYDKNAVTAVGNVPVDSLNYYTGDVVSVKGNLGDSNLTNPGFTFLGWSKMANGSSGLLAGGSTFAMGTSNVTLYAQWLPDNPSETKYTLTYNANGVAVTVPTPVTNLATGSTPTVGSPSALKYSNYKFVEWNLMQNGFGNAYAPGSNITIFMSDVTLYAQWVPFYVVSYNGNGNTSGTVPNDDTEYFKNAVVTVLGNGSLEKTNHTFSGWNTQADGLGTTYMSTFVMGSANVTLYAMWTPNTTEPTTATPTTAEPTTAVPTETPTSSVPTTEPETQPPTASTIASTTASTEESTEELTEELIPEGAAIIVNFDEPLDSSTFEEVVELGTEAIPLAPALPQTGQLPVELFYGIGGLITAAGVFLRKNK